MWSILVQVLLALSLLAGCGNRGGLVLPPKPQAVPASLVPGPSSSAPDSDRSVAGDPTRQDSSTAASETGR
ncbi:MAG TPA: lipoprotein [Candidatus Accumulibacter phosphatis]|nr:lipoprotein [Candidatus Accumulibacter phosphatis]HRQ93899.1 lipoprotein [Candidatus Accumulibacter phosphatis]